MKVYRDISNLESKALARESGWCSRITPICKNFSRVETVCLAVTFVGALLLVTSVVLGIVGAFSSGNIPLLSVAELFILLATLIITVIASVVTTSLLHLKRREKKGEPLSPIAYMKKEFLDLLPTAKEQTPYQSSGPVIEALVKTGAVWPAVWHLEDHEATSMFGIDKRCSIKFRSVRDLLTIFLGFFSLGELKELLSFISHSKRSTKASSFSSYDRLYAACIKRWPKIVAVEAAHFAWLKHCYPYLGDAQDAFFIDKTFSYKSEFFSRIEGFFQIELCEDRLEKIYLLEKFRGWIPTCLTSISFPLGEKYFEVPASADMNWETFVTKASQFCFLSSRYKGAFGNWEAFLQFVEKGEEAFYGHDFVHSKYAFTETNFFQQPKALWDLGSLCDEDSELERKIEEGLAVLENCGYLGEESLDAIKAFECQVLGLDPV
ncbi:hypothetical protein [Chlamydiifrater phoenicopteri]|uniref:hypothetical protein n=1 Tax=Chlamydiifrater phoenicopteri TaxID=2681469 RepID=UPI001BD0BCAD|nr:hypothetical protein [Chlamydiifrater phoenicopteri]